jgi:hypothetical protein
MAQIVERMLRAAKLDPSLYEEVEADPAALGQALGVVVLSSVAGGLGAPGAGGVGLVVLGTVSALLSWFIWAYLTYLIGVKVMPEPQTRSSPGELLRTIGFSSAPGLVRILGLIRPLAWIVFAVATVWMLAAMVVAVRQALDYRSTGRAVGVCVVAWAIQAAVLALLLTVFGGPP